MVNDTSRLLRATVAPQAFAFGIRLLECGNGDVVKFGDFLSTARGMIATVPEDAARYLAALVALDMATTGEPLSRPSPSVN